jgi:peroxiredoxin
MLLKSIFITSYISLIHIVLGFSIYQLNTQGFSWLWTSVLLSALPGSLFFEYLILFKPLARTPPHLLIITTIKSLALMTVLGLNYYYAQVHIMSIVATTLSLFGWITYDYWYSKYAHRDKEKLIIGSNLPNLKLRTAFGEDFNSHVLHGSPAIYIFYRGNWCPLCMAQIKEIASQYKKLSKQGTKIALISPQSDLNSQKLSQKFNVPFIFLVDKNNKVAKQLGIFAQDGLPMGMQALGYESDTVMPTVVITNQDNKIIFADLTDNYRVRPEPDTFLRVLAENAN